jgi:hypothetical protein
MGRPSAWQLVLLVGYLLPTPAPTSPSPTPTRTSATHPVHLPGQPLHLHGSRVGRRCHPLPSGRQVLRQGYREVHIQGRRGGQQPLRFCGQQPGQQGWRLRGPLRGGHGPGGATRHDRHGARPLGSWAKHARFACNRGVSFELGPLPPYRPGSRFFDVYEYEIGQWRFRRGSLGSGSHLEAVRRSTKSPDPRWLNMAYSAGCSSNIVSRAALVIQYAPSAGLGGRSA